MMPGLDGFEVCRRIKANPQTQDIPIIFLTAKVGVDASSKAFSLGAVDYITKPFHADELLARIKSHIQLFHAK
jgi:putative two-component system response regulator